ncbi:MAG: sugar phosphate isomerase/epimerase family protein [Sedimentitalea sp.]|uniref:sugar phosphate isomerase/epimerase family protein n=1 Tax=Sedimentitalea sp. TaxID=2048915 RepID=UPI003263523E
MNFAVSNIAWKSDERLAAYAALAAQDVRGLEIAPGLLFDGAEDVFVPDEALAQERLSEVADAGLSLVSMQSLLFGVEGAALFEGEAALARLVTGMKRAIDLAGRFEIPNLVFGSPKQRVIPEAMTRTQATDHAEVVFQQLGDYAASAGTTIGMEANPAVYGTNFLTHAEAAAEFVRNLDHPAIKMVFDVGTMHLNDAFDQSTNLIAEHAPILSHVHISEPYLEPAPAQAETAATILHALGSVKYDHWVSIEMKAAPENRVDQMSQAVQRLRNADEMAKRVS